MQAHADRNRLQQQIYKWLSIRDNDIADVATALGLQQRKAWFPTAEAELIRLFQERRSKGIPVHELWMVVTMKQLVHDSEPESEHKRTFKATHGWVRRFVARNGLVPRSKTNTKMKPLEERLPLIQATF